MSFAGRLKIWQVRGASLAAEDSISKSSDPYFVIKYPSGEKFKSQHFDENLNPVWTDLTLEWDFSNLGMTQEFRLEVFDHDTIGSDDEIGFATFTLKDIAERHSHDDNPLELHLKTTKGVTVGRGTMYLHCYLVCPDLVNVDLFSADTAAVVRALNIMKNVAASSRFFDAPNQYWDNNDRFQRIVQLATAPSACAEAAVQSFLPYFFAAISPPYASKLQPARKEQLKAALDSLWSGPVSHKPLVLGLLDHARLLAPEFEALVVARAADAVPVLLSSPAANDVALVKAMFGLLKLISGGIQALATRRATIDALEDFCLRVPFTEGAPLEAALLLCEAFQKCGVQATGTDGAKLTRLFNPWLTDMAISNQAAVPLMNAYKELKKLNLPFDEVALFQNKALPARAFAYHFQIAEVPLVGACPQPAPGGPAALPPVAPGTPVPPVTGDGVQYFLPQAALFTGTVDDDWCYSFAGQHVTFVQEAATQRPFTPVAAALMAPRASPSPARVVMIWAADRLPDLNDLNGSNTADSAALFFSSPHPDYLHPAMYIDARHDTSSYRFASAVSTYLHPTRYLVIRLHATSPTQAMHQIQTIKVVGYTGTDAIPAGPPLTAAIESQIHSLPGYVYHDINVEPEVYPQQVVAVQPPNMSDRVAGVGESSPTHPAFFVGQTYYPCYYSAGSGQWRPLYNTAQVSAFKWTIIYPETSVPASSSGGSYGSSDVSSGSSTTTIVRNTYVYASGHPYYHYRPTYYSGLYRPTYGIGSPIRSGPIVHHTTPTTSYHPTTTSHSSGFGSHGFSGLS